MSGRRVGVVSGAEFTWPLAKGAGRRTDTYCTATVVGVYRVCIVPSDRHWTSEPRSTCALSAACSLRLRARCRPHHTQPPPHLCTRRLRPLFHWNGPKISVHSHPRRQGDSPSQPAFTFAALRQRGNFLLNFRTCDRAPGLLRTHRDARRSRFREKKLAARSDFLSIICLPAVDARKG